MSGITTFGQLEVHSIQHVFVAVTSDFLCPAEKERGKADLERGRGVVLVQPGRNLHHGVELYPGRINSHFVVRYKWMYRYIHETHVVHEHVFGFIVSLCFLSAAFCVVNGGLCLSAAIFSR